MNYTYSDIVRRIRSGLTIKASSIEGSFGYDIAGTVANEMASIHSQEIDPMLSRAHADTAIGDYLDDVARDRGISRNEAISAEVYVTLVGIPGTSYGSGEVKVHANKIVFTLDKFELTSEGTADVRAVCDAPGSQGNVLEGTIKDFYKNYLGLESCYNKADATGGYDKEKDEEFRTRILDVIQTPSTSGNIADYKKWAKDITGVYKAKILDLFRGNGTVDVILVANGNEEAPSVLCNRVAEHIAEMRPIGADVLVQSAVAKQIQVKAVITIKDSYTLSNIKEKYVEELKKYEETLLLDAETVSYKRCWNILFNLDGVENMDTFLLNDTEDNIAIGAKEFPVFIAPIFS